MNGPDGKPTKPDDDFEPLVPALEGSFEKKFSELSAELQEWIKHDRRAAMLALMWDVSGAGRRRTLAQHRDWATEQAVLQHEKAVLQHEEAVIQQGKAALLQRARAVGLDNWADDWDSIPENVPEKLGADTEKGNTSKGGAPPRPDRDEFDREVVRRLALDGGDISLTQFRNGMKQWASDNMNPPPDDRTVERWINRLVPPGVFPN